MRKVWAFAAALAVAGIALAEDGPAPKHRGLIGPVGGRHRVHDHTGADCCGVDSMVLASRFSAALKAFAGKAHPVVTAQAPGLPPHPAIGGEALLRLRRGIAAATVAARHGLEVRRDVPALGICAVGTEGADPVALAAMLRGDPDVLSASPNWVARCSATTPNDDLFPLQIGPRGIGIEDAWDTSKGAGVVVAVLDTGVDGRHPDLQGVVPTATGWVDLVNGSPTPVDDNGHGTAVAGIIAARFQNSIGTAGIAPESTLLAIKVADRNGVASFADVIAGINEAVNRGARIVNLSIGSYIDDAALKTAVDNALNAGTLVIAAAGNENVNAPTYPAAYPGVLAIGGSGSRPSGPGGIPLVPAPPPEIAFSTVLAPSLALLAPSEKVVAPLPGGVWGFVNGTSAAAAHTAGIAALVHANAPTLTRDQLAQVLRQSTEAVPALGAVAENFPFGRLNAKAALDRGKPTYVDIAVVGWTLLPLEPAANQTPLVRARFQNQGSGPIANAIVKALYYTPGAALGVEIAAVALPNLAMGETRSVDFIWTTAPALGAGNYDIEVVANAVAGEAELADNVSRRAIRILPQGVADVGIAKLEAKPDYVTATKAVAVETVVRNLGNTDETLVDVTFLANGTAFQTQQIAFLATRAEQVVRATWPIPAANPPERVAFAVEVAPRASETSTFDNAAEAQVRIGVASATPVDVLYQQGNDVDLISDAPFRLAGNRTYVPLLLFAPAKGDPDPDTYLTFKKAQVFAKSDPNPASPATLIYQDATSGQPTTALAGITATDENGTVLPTLNIFEDLELRRNGRHMMLRIPRTAWPAVPLPADRYLDVRMEWEFHRKLLWIFTVTRDGTNRKVLKTTFADGALPSVPGDNHYYDVHNHTIAEWFVSSPLNLFAPRKAYGGPVIMIAESAYAVGMIDSPTDVKDLVATTDHNTFFNTTVGDPNHPDRRPPFGPTSPAMSVGSGGSITPEHERYREIFGLSAGEEIACQADQVVSYVGITLGVPLGCHMVSYRGEHIEGPWHGGGWIPDPSAPSIDVPLADFLKKWATQNQAENANAFIYAAHPFSDMLGWPDGHLRLALGLDPQHRSPDYVHASPPNFVFKGFQLFNGRSARSLPYNVIDFDDLNPWIDQTWQAGNARWDGKLTEGLVFWHRAVADGLAWAFTADPDGVFIRKTFIAGGSDAHGDFNYSISRLATPVLFQFTFSVSGDPYAAVRTYVFGDGFPGATRGERLMQAFAAGRSIATDGPVVAFTMDAEGRFDAQNLKWHDKLDQAEDDDGLMGGGGAFDGGGTMLVREGAPSVWFRYVHDVSSDFGSGSIAAIKVYKDSPGAPNPSRIRAGHPEPIGVGALAVSSTSRQILSERLDPAEEGLITAPSAYSLGAFTGSDPDITPLGIEERRCYTNPVWALPVKISYTASHASPAQWGPNELAITLEFPVSMNPAAGTVELKPLDANGDTTDGTVAGTPLAATWTAAGGARNAKLTLTNSQAIPLSGDAYPAAGTKTFAVYFRTPPQDLNGNALNALAFTISTAGGGGGGSTSSPVLGGSRRSSGGGGGGCAAAPGSAALPSLLPYLAIGLAIFVGRRRRGAAETR